MHKVRALDEDYPVVPLQTVQAGVVVHVLHLELQAIIIYYIFYSKLIINEIIH